MRVGYLGPPGTFAEEALLGLLGPDPGAEAVPYPSVVDCFEAVEQVRANPHEQGGMAPVYGMAGTVPFRGVLSDLLKKYMDLIARV